MTDCSNAILGKKMIGTANKRTASLYLLVVFMEVLSRLKGILRLYRRNGASDLTSSRDSFSLGSDGQPSYVGVAGKAVSRVAVVSIDYLAAAGV